MKKHKGTAKDSRGCSFGYTCFSTSYYIGGIKVIDRIYQSHVFDHIESSTLHGLKKMMGKL